MSMLVYIIDHVTMTAHCKQASEHYLVSYESMESTDLSVRPQLLP